jgi:exopolysaccharide production protein ExoQ
LNATVRYDNRVPRRAHFSTVPKIYYWISVFFLLNSMAVLGFIDRMIYGSWSNKGGDKITLMLNLLQILTSLTLFIYGYSRRRTIGTGALLALLATAYFLLTVFWSYDPGTTIRQAINYFFLILGSIGIASILNPDEYMDLLGWTCFSSAVASLVLLIVSPASAHGGGLNSEDFQGVFSHKNVLGQVMMTGALASLHAIRVGGRWRRRNIFFLFVFIFMAFESKSATSWLAIAACCCVDAIIVLYRKGGAARSAGMLTAVTAVPILILVTAYPDPILEMLGKDPTLTGRTDLWEYVISDIWMKPLLGWGYFGFWTPANPAAMQIADDLRWIVPQAHNGLLEMLLNIGLVGTALVIFLLVRNIVMAVRCLHTPAAALGISTLLCCGGIFLIGVSEAVMLTSVQSSTGMFLITGFLCERGLRAAELRRHRSPPKGYPGRAPLQPASRFPNAGRSRT